MIRVVLDSNALDGLLSHAEVLRAAIADRRLLASWTHVTGDEIAAIGDAHKRDQLAEFAASIAVLVPTGAFVLGSSRLDMASLGEDASPVDDIRRGADSYTNDALISATAEMDDAILVTNDLRFRKRAEARGLQVLSTTDLVALIG